MHTTRYWTLVLAAALMKLMGDGIVIDVNKHPIIPIPDDTEVSISAVPVAPDPAALVPPTPAQAEEAARWLSE